MQAQLSWLTFMAKTCMDALMEYLYIWTEQQAIDDHDDDAKKSADVKEDM